MNLTLLIGQLAPEDFNKMLAACKTHRERFYLQIARVDPGFEYHVGTCRKNRDQVLGVRGQSTPPADTVDPADISSGCGVIRYANLARRRKEVSQ